ncbi:MAG: CpsD/CapB family tyrosine-protein kinase [Acidobacteria bacterium]|nr:CpsD/CapB family tyrosine-protein kinase [Acidobacteriota bacterium]
MESLTSEQYKRVALAVASPGRDGRHRSVLISSATAGEGTTSATVFVGRSLVRDFGLRTAIVEVNWVRPSLAELFDLDADRSVAAALSGRLPLRSCLQDDGAGLGLLPAGDLKELEQKRGWQKALCGMLHELEADFEVSLVDLPPLLESADALVAGSVVPQMILVVSAGWASRQAIGRAVQELERANIQLIGTIFNERKRILPQWLDHWLGR